MGQYKDTASSSKEDKTSCYVILLTKFKRMYLLLAFSNLIIEGVKDLQWAEQFVLLRGILKASLRALE